MRSLDTLAARARAEYLEMPGLCLTAEQASRLWGVNRGVCETVLAQLVLDGVLYRTRSGMYVAAPPVGEGA